MSPLSILCVGTGRDGTTSVAQMIQSLFDKEGNGRRASHEWGAVQLYQLECAFRESGDETFLNSATRLIRKCPYDCVVGNGYAPVLPIFADLFGTKTVLIHVRRRDRSRCIASLSENAVLFPDNYFYYGTGASPTGKRIAAFHYGEATREEWGSWSIERRFGWYYDKTHAMIDEAAPRFRTVLEIETEALDTEECRRALSRAVGIRFVPDAVHVNRHVPLDLLPAEMHPWVQQLLGTFNIARLATDELYGLRHFLRSYEERIQSKNDPLLRVKYEALIKSYSSMAGRNTRRFLRHWIRSGWWKLLRTYWRWCKSLPGIT